MSFYNWLGTFLGTRKTWLSESFERLKRLGWGKVIAISAALFLLLKATKSFLFWPFIVGILIVYFVSKKVHSRIIKVAFLTLTLPIVSLLGLFLLADLISPLDRTEKTRVTQDKKEVLKVSPTPQQLKTVKASPTPIPKKKRVRYTVLSGIEKDPLSEAYGELVVPEINLWSDYGDRLAKGAKVIGRVKHNTKVEILEEAEGEGVNGPRTKYYKVKDPTGVAGWVSELFITEITEK